MTRIWAGVAVLSVALLGSAYAQEKDKDKKKTEDPPAKLKGMLPPNFGKLRLSEEQKQKVYKIRADYKAKIDDLNKRIARLKDDEKEAMDKVLTDQQRKELRKLRTGEKP
jgi:hypothetical protein